jgi:hypothetical protein
MSPEEAEEEKDQYIKEQEAAKNKGLLSKLLG